MSQYYAALAGCCISLSFALRASAAQDDVAERGQFLMDGIRAQRERLETGVFRVAGTVTDQIAEFGHLEGDITIFAAFDFPKGKLRFDRSEPQVFIDEHGTWRRGIRGGQFARTPDAVTELYCDHDVCSVMPVHNSNPSWAKALDVRSLGLGYQHDLETSTPFLETWNNYQKAGPAEVAEEVICFTGSETFLGR